MQLYGKFKVLFFGISGFFKIFLIRVWLNPQMWNPQIEEGRFLLLFQVANEATEYQRRWGNFFEASQLLSCERNQAQVCLTPNIALFLLYSIHWYTLSLTYLINTNICLKRHAGSLKKDYIMDKPQKDLMDKKDNNISHQVQRF